LAAEEQAARPEGGQEEGQQGAHQAEEAGQQIQRPQRGQRRRQRGAQRQREQQRHQREHPHRQRQAAPARRDRAEQRSHADPQQGTKGFHWAASSRSSWRKTSSRLLLPTISAVGPASIRRPFFRIASLSQSFSATSSTWVEKNTAPPSRQSWRSICLRV